MQANFLAIDPHKYGPDVAALLESARLMELGPGQADRKLADVRRRISLERLFPASTIADQDMALCCQAGLLLLHDFLDESHEVSQGIETTTGSYWHGIMHRREPDSSNAKYWFRRVGRHPVFGPLAEIVREMLAGTELSQWKHLAAMRDRTEWDPMRFVDACEAASGSDDALCREIQACEWKLLFDYCYGQALGRRED